MNTFILCVCSISIVLEAASATDAKVDHVEVMDMLNDDMNDLNAECNGILAVTNYFAVKYDSVNQYHPFLMLYNGYWIWKLLLRNLLLINAGIF